MDGSDEVLIEYQDVKIRADAAHYDFPTKTATLVGHVVIDQGPTRLAGERATFQLEAKTGTIEVATADLSPAYHVIAKTIEKIGEATYRIHDGIFTACDIPKPSWSFHLSDAVVTLDDYARMKDVSFWARNVPLFYTPYLVWPTKEDRASGMLVPGAGYSSRRGAYLGLTNYWVTGRSTDLTTNVDLYSRGSFGLGEELRWTPSPESAGFFQGYAIHDTSATVCVPIAEEPSGGDGPCTLPDGTPGVSTTRTRNRWKFRLEHIADDLPYGFRGVVDVRDYSDEEYLQDFERSFALNSARQVLSRAFVTKNLGDNSLNIRFERSETFFGTLVRQERLPSVEFSRRTSQVGETPLFFALESSLSWLYINRGPGLPRGDYARADVHPTVSFPWKRIPWLSITARAGGRWTGYTDSTDSLETRFTGQTLAREYGEAGLSIVGPSFSRIYDVAIGRFGKFKHVIEPRIDYSYISEVGSPERIPTYDEVDLPLGQNQVRYAIVNRLLARSADPKAGAAEEIASLEVSQTRVHTAADHDSDCRQRRERLLSAFDFEIRASRGDAAGRAGSRFSSRRTDLVRRRRGPAHRDLDLRRLLVEQELRERDLVREPAGPRRAASGGFDLPEFRSAPVRRRSRALEIVSRGHPVELRRAPEPAPRGPVSRGLPRFLLHDLPGAAAAPAAPDAPPGHPPRDQSEGDRDAPRPPSERRPDLRTVRAAVPVMIPLP